MVTLLLLVANPLGLPEGALRERLALLQQLALLQLLALLLLLMLLRRWLAAGWNSGFSRASLAARRRVDEGFRFWVVGSRRRRLFDVFLQSFCEMGREGVAARIDVDGWVEGLNKEGFFNASFHPILIRREDGDIFFSEVVAVLACMLEHGRFIVAKSIGRGGEMLLETTQT